jgi:predicted DNA-binding protein
MYDRRNNMATASIRLDEELVQKATIMAKALNRTTPKQIEHWAKIGEMMEDNPDLPYEFVKQAIIAKAEKEAGKLEEYSFG